MSRKLKRVPMDFAWPWEHEKNKSKVWKGYINPYAKLMADCKACTYEKHGARGYSPDGHRYHQEWYGYVEFDPIAYGSKPIPLDHPRIREFATMQVNRSPEFYMTNAERRRERENFQKAGVDLLEIYKTTEELRAELDKPASELEELQKEGLIQIHNHRGPAIEREIKRLHEVCIQDHWCHHLNQDDVDALVAERRLPEFTHRPRNQEQADKLKAQEEAGGSGYWLDEPNGYHPTADEVNGWALFGMGHDSINAWVCMKARARREYTMLECAVCRGKGYHWEDVEYDDLPRLTEGLLKPDMILAIEPVGKLVPAAMIEQLYEEWKDYEPPVGPGFQLWETVSEGSPCSPVFATFDELCEWAEKNHRLCNDYVSKEQWKKMLDDGFVYHEMRRDDGSLIGIMV